MAKYLGLSPFFSLPNFYVDQMGTMMTHHIFDKHGIFQINRPYRYLYADGLPRHDFRDVYLLRNIYSSLVSGYLFHKEGKECDHGNHKGEAYVREWYHYLTFTPEHIYGHTLCERLEAEPDEVG